MNGSMTNARRASMTLGVVAAILAVAGVTVGLMERTATSTFVGSFTDGFMFSQDTLVRCGSAWSPDPYVTAAVCEAARSSALMWSLALLVCAVMVAVTALVLTTHVSARPRERA